MKYILILLSILFTVPFSANAADSEGCGPLYFYNYDGEEARWEPAEQNGCDYDPNRGLFCPRGSSYIYGYHPLANLKPSYTEEEVLEISNREDGFNIICEPNMIREEIPDPEGGDDPLGYCYKIYYYNADRETGQWTTNCLPVYGLNINYHYEQTDTFEFYTHTSYNYEKHRIDYGVILSNTESCSTYINRLHDNHAPESEYMCNQETQDRGVTIEGEHTWVPFDDDLESYGSGYGAWDMSTCLCRYETYLEWDTTTEAEIICKYNSNEDGPRWYTPYETNRKSDPNKCYVSQAYACQKGHCILEADGKECKESPSGYYHANNTDTQCIGCPAGTTSDEGAGTASDCYVPTGATFTDSNGSFSLGELGATDDIYYEQ